MEVRPKIVFAFGGDTRSGRSFIQKSHARSDDRIHNFSSERSGPFGSVAKRSFAGEKNLRLFSAEEWPV
eukprot:6207658-Pleurochrysis_carterae.AAC.5